MRVYISPADYERAAKNGIPAKTLESRIHTQGMDKERAVTQKVQKHQDRSKWHGKMKENNISSQTFQNRVNSLKWDEERAATEKVESFNLQKYWERRGRSYSLELIEFAAKHGVSYDTLRKRIKYEGMDPIEAATKPVKKYVRRKGSRKL